MENYKETGLILAIIFLIALLFFEIQNFRGVFVLLFILLLAVFFLEEKYRMFIWLLCAFFIGKLIFLYGDRLMLELPLSNRLSFTGSQFLFLIPISLMLYISKKFKEETHFNWRRPKWQFTFHLPLINLKIPVRNMLLIGISLSSLLFLPSILKEDFNFSLDLMIMGLVFSIANGVLQEVLWRGIFLRVFVRLAGNFLAVAVTSIAFGISQFSLGFSVLACLGFIVIGYLFALITLKSNSLLPSTIWHIVVNFLLILNGTIPLLFLEPL